MMERRNQGKLPLSEELVRALVAAVEDHEHGTRTEEICEAIGESPQRLGDAFEFVKERGILLGFAGLWFHPEAYERGTERFLTAVSDLHRLNPGRAAIEPRQVTSRAELDWTHKATARIVRELIRTGRLKGDEDGVRLGTFVAQMPTKQEVTLARVVAALEDGGFRPPVGPGLAAVTKMPTQALREVLRLGEFTDRLVPMENGIWTTPGVLDRAHAAFLSVAPGGVITIALARTALDASRRYAHAFLVRLADEGRVESVDGEWRVYAARKEADAD